MKGRKAWPIGLVLLLAGTISGTAGPADREAAEKNRSASAVTVHSGASERPALRESASGFDVLFSDARGSWSRPFTANARPVGASRRTQEMPPASEHRSIELSGGVRVEVVERWRAGAGSAPGSFEVVVLVTAADGSRRSFRVAEQAGDQLEPVIAAHGDDGFVVAWQGRDPTAEGGDWDVYFRRFSSADAPAAQAGGPVQRAHPRQPGDQVEPALLATGDGVVIAWRSLEPAGLFLRLLGDLIFADDFESGLSAWSEVEGAPLSAAFTRTPDFGFTPLAVSFDAAVSYDPGGGPADFSWDFGDGTDGSGESVVHAYAAPGRFEVTLTLTGSGGGMATASTFVDVLPAEALGTVMIVTVRNDAAPGLVAGRAASAVASLRNDTAPGLATGRAASALVSSRNDVSPQLLAGRAEAPLVSVRNDGEP